MIFKPELARLVAKGKKTQTRRLVNGKPTRYEVGQDYAVQPGRGKTQICRVTVLDRRRERLGDLSFEDAQAEGFRGRADFARYWMDLIHDKRHAPADGLPADDVLELWQQRHGDRVVWVIIFELTRPLKLTLPNTPVYLTKARSTRGGTTRDPRHKMPGEPAVIGDVSVGSLGRARNAALRERQQRLQQMHQVVERARNAWEQAIAGDLAVDEDIDELERFVHHLEAKLRAA